MKLKLLSDFRDDYDIWFDRNGDTVFRRMTTDGPSRIQMFDMFAKKKAVYNPPIHGIVRNIWKEAQKLVVYTDLRAHRGEGKELLPSDQAFKKWPNAFASAYIEGPPVSLRLIQIGWMSFWLRYKSNDKWRSNVGDVEITVEAMGAQNDFLEEYPLVAVDYVPDSADKPHAVDFNVAPGIRHTGIEDHLKGNEIVDLIRLAMEKKEGKTIC